MFGKKQKKERQKQKERLKKMFKMQLDEFRTRAREEDKMLREIYWEHHFFLQSRQATNIITADRVGRGEKTRAIEIDEIADRDDKAEDIFREALDEFIYEAGETEPGVGEEVMDEKDDKKESGAAENGDSRVNPDSGKIDLTVHQEKTAELSADDLKAAGADNKKDDSPDDGGRGDEAESE